MLPAEEEPVALAPINGQSVVPADSQFWTKEDISQFMDLVADYSAALGHCLKGADKYGEAGLVQDEESARTLAITRFIAATRRMKK